MELILDGEYKTVDLSRFHFNRFITQEAVQENNIVWVRHECCDPTEMFNVDLRSALS